LRLGRGARNFGEIKWSLHCMQQTSILVTLSGRSMSSLGFQRQVDRPGSTSTKNDARKNYQSEEEHSSYMQSESMFLFKTVQSTETAHR